MKKRNWKALLALLALVLVVGVGAKMYSNITMGDDEWVGLGAGAGRIVFDDQITDEVSVMNAYVGLATASPTALLHLDGSGVGNGIKLTRGALTSQWFGGHNGPAYFGTESNDDLHLRTNATTEVTIKADGKVGINDTTPSYDLDVTGDIRATDDVFVNDDLTVGGEVHTGPDVTDIDARSDMPFATAEDGQGGYFFYNVNISSDTDLTGIYSTEANVERQTWVRWLVYDVTAATEHYGETVLDYTGGVSSVVISDEGANDLLFKVARGAPPNPVGYLCLDVVGNHTYEVVLMTMWH